MGVRWNTDMNMWNEEVQRLTALNARIIVENCPMLTQQEQTFLQNDKGGAYFLRKNSSFSYANQHLNRDPRFNQRSSIGVGHKGER